MPSPRVEESEGAAQQGGRELEFAGQRTEQRERESTLWKFAGLLQSLAE